MKKNISKLIRIAAVGTVCAGLLATALPAVALESSRLPLNQSMVGNWMVSDLSTETSVRQIEAFKVSRDFVAWTELDSASQLRRLLAFDGVSVTQVAVMNRYEWDRDSDNPFFNSVAGNFDLADGLLVWTASDGLDREIWSFDGFTVRQVSNNTYDDAHPVTSKGRIAWTSYPGNAYNLMVSDSQGLNRLDGWHVQNYAFSGQNLYWLNRLSNENWFRVFVNDGQTTKTIGKGDDRPLNRYFYTDGEGTAAWEYSTKQWSYDKREIFLSYQGQTPIQRIIQRDVPPNVTQIEDVVGRSVYLNVTNMLQSPIWNRVSLIRSDGGEEEYLTNFTSTVRARHLGDGVMVRHLAPDTASYLVLGDGSDNTNFIKSEHVIHNRFEAKNGVLAGALLKGGMLLHDGKETLTIPTHAEGQTQRLAVNGCVAWLEGDDAAAGRLRAACPTVAVKNSTTGVSRVAGRLVKSATNPSVYLAASDGQRYLFSSEAQFFGWYSDFSTVRTIPDADLSAIHLAGSALMRPGFLPVKIASSPRVYSVYEDGLLRWVTSGDVMEDLYGTDWTYKVAVMPDSALSDYRFGAPIESSLKGSIALNY